MAGGGFILGVDFGTSNTVAMLRRPDGRVAPLLFDGTPVLPSAVCAAPTGGLAVGQDALHHARHHPDALEPNPKRRIDDGTVLLGATAFPVTEIIGAVFGRVGHEAVRVAGGRPQTLVLSHPAGWGPVRRLALIDAALSAGLPRPVFVAEPAAAARYFVSVLGGSVPAGAALMVYDLGAGTFDVSVLRAGAGGVEVLGSDGLTDLGGLDVDAAVVGWLRDRYDPATWARLDRPATAEDRRIRHDLWTEARVAKEMLSRTSTVLLRPPLLATEVPLTLAEFEEVVRPLIDSTVRTAQGLARHCGIDAAQVLLVGGSSRIPLVATALHRAFGVAPTVTEQPETVVAEGCVLAVDGAAPVVADDPLSVALPVSPAPPVAGPVSAPVWPLSPAATAMTTSVREPSVLPAQREPWASEIETSTVEVPAASAASPSAAAAPTVEMPAVARPAPRQSRPAAGAPGAPVEAATPVTIDPTTTHPGDPDRASRNRPADPDRTSVERGPAGGPTAGGPTAARPPTARPPTARPPTARPPTARQPTGRPPAGPPRTRPGARLVVVLLSVLILLAGGSLILLSRGGAPGGGPPRGKGGGDPTVLPTPGPPFPSAWPVRYRDPLVEPRLWTPTVEPIVSAECAFRGDRLEVDMRTAGISRCPGQKDALDDFALRIDVHLIDGRTCAGIWFRRSAHEDGKDSGYLLKVCATELLLGHHHADGKIVDFARMRIDKIEPGGRATIGISVLGGEIALYHNDTFVGRHTDTTYRDGRIALGIAVPVEVGTGQVGFTDIEMRVPTAGGEPSGSPPGS